MRISRVHGNHEVGTIEELDSILALRDEAGGEMFWLSHEGMEFPALVIRVSGEVSDIHFFPQDRHPGFRCIGSGGPDAEGSTLFRYQGCDPASGETCPNRFVVSSDTARSVAIEFFRSRQMSTAEAWVEL